MRTINRSIGDVIGNSKILINTIPLSSCKFNVINNAIAMNYNGEEVGYFELNVDISNTKMLEIAVVEFYNILVLLSNNTYTVCNMGYDDVVELVIKPLNTRLAHMKTLVS
jgi:hypothetical protein